MLINTLLLAHIVVLGYWLGSDLIINHTFRYVSRAASMPVPERDRLLDHVMDIDQHVRYALVLQAGLGTALAALLGYLPGGGMLAGVAGFATLGWLVLIETSHQLRKRRPGASLGQLDRGIRYAMIVAALLLAGSGVTGYIDMAAWLAVKLALFAAVIASGVVIRFELVRYFAIWHEITAEGSSDDRESLLRLRYFRATTVLLMLWLCIAAIVALSLIKP